MKKFLTCAALGSLFMSLCSTASAEVKVGGVLGAEFWFDHASKETRMSGGEETNEVWLNGGNLLGELNVDFNSDKIKIHTRVNLDGQRADQPKNNPGNDWRFADDMYLAQIHIDWIFSDTFNVRMGKQEALLGPLAPFDIDGPVHLRDMGNLGKNSEVSGFRFNAKLANQLTASLLIADPNTNNNETLGTINGAKEENVLPRMDVSLQYVTDKLTIIPAFSYLTQRYDNLAASYDDTINIWGGSLSGELRLNKLMFRAEAYFGENLGDGNYTGADGFAAYAGQGSSILVNNKIFDTTTYGGFFEVMYTIDDKWSVGGAAGAARYLNDDAPGANNEYDATDMGYAFTVHYMALPNVLIAPQLRYYVFDDSATVAGATQDHGSTLAVGAAVVVFF